MSVFNESSVILQARWDWSNNSVAGKWGPEQQVYRKTRPYVPPDDHPDGPLQDGLPLVVTRNKVRGRGRALSLKFAAEPGKDAHIVGWATNFDILVDT